MVARTAKRKLIFEAYDEQAKNIFNVFTDLDKNETIAGEIFYNNQLKVFSVYTPSKTDRVINCYILDVLNKSIKKVELFKTSVEKQQSLFSGQNKRQTNFAISDNEKFLAVATDNIKKTFKLLFSTCF